MNEQRLKEIATAMAAYLEELWEKYEKSPKEHAKEIFGLSEEEADEFFSY